MVDQQFHIICHIQKVYKKESTFLDVCSQQMSCTVGEILDNV